MESREFKLPKWGTVWAFLTDGVEGVTVYAVTQFNKQVLSKIKNPEELKPYIGDLFALIVFLRTVMENHASKISEKKFKAWSSVLKTLEELNRAFEDMNLTPEEFQQLLSNIRLTIKAFKDA